MVAFPKVIGLAAKVGSWADPQVEHGLAGPAAASNGDDCQRGIAVGYCVRRLVAALVAIGREQAVDQSESSERPDARLCLDLQGDVAKGAVFDQIERIPVLLPVLRNAAIAGHFRSV